MGVAAYGRFCANRPSGDAKPQVVPIIMVSVALSDVVLDIFFVYTVMTNPRSGDGSIIPLVSLCCVVFPVFVNMMICTITFCKELKNQQFSDWFEKNTMPASAILVLSFTHPETLLVLQSKITGHGVFNAPFKISTKRKISTSGTGLHACVFGYA